MIIINYVYVEELTVETVHCFIEDSVCSKVLDVFVLCSVKSKESIQDELVGVVDYSSKYVATKF